MSGTARRSAERAPFYLGWSSSLLPAHYRTFRGPFPRHLQDKVANDGKIERGWSFRLRGKNANEACVQTADVTVASISAVVGATDAALTIAGAFVRGTASAAAMFGLFAPLVTSALNLASEIIKLYQTAEHNKRTCMCLVRRVMAADL